MIIGFGKGGKTLAQDLAANGEKVVVIEKSDQMYGGTCINVGCIPTKSLVQNSKFSSRHTDWDFAKKADFYKKAINEKRELTAFLRQKNYAMLADNPNITVVNGFASFIDKNNVKVTNASGCDVVFSADKIFINTGAKEIVPSIPGVDNEGVYTSATLLELDKLPKSMVIVGGGYIGMEFASMYSSFGTEVTVLEFGPILIGREDRDIADAVKARLEKKGVKFIFNADTQEIRANAVGNSVIYKDRIQGVDMQVDGEAVLIAIGRRPNTAGLNLEAAGIELTERGAIKTNEFLQTSQQNIWAMGDIAGREQFTYISLDDYRIVLDSLYGSKSRSVLDRKNVPYSVFIDPPMSRVGISESDALKLGLDFVVATLPAGAIPKARLLNETDGLLKLLVEKSSGKILGCTLFCADSHEMINFVSAVMKLGADYTFLRDFIFTHPTMSESLNDLAKKIKL